MISSYCGSPATAPDARAHDDRLQDAELADRDDELLELVRANS